MLWICFNSNALSTREKRLFSPKMPLAAKVCSAVANHNSTFDGQNAGSVMLVGPDEKEWSEETIDLCG